MRSLLPCALFFTGATSLVLESVWFRRLTLLFGATGYAAATVFTAFMAGLALGSTIAGRWAGRLPDRRSLLTAYALVEAAIGLCAVALPLSGEALLPVLGASGQGGAGVLPRFGLALAVLLVPTTLMGATLPLAGRAYAVRGSGHIGSEGGALYAANTLGAVAGTIACGFFLLPAIGVRATTLVAASVNGCVAMAVLVGASPLGARLRVGLDPALAPVDPPSALGPRTWRMRLALWVFGVSGAVALVYEEVWQRALQLVIGSSVYSFAILLSSYLLGLALGAAVYSRRTAGRPDQAGNLALAELLVAAAAAAGLLLLDDLPAAFLVLVRWIPLEPAPALLAQSALAGSIVLLPTFFLGMTFPAMLAWVGASEPGVGGARAIGRVYAANTAGAIVGSFSGGFVLIPRLGLHGTLLLLVVITIATGLAFALLGQSRRPALIAAAGVLALVIAIPWLGRPWNLKAMNAGVFRLSTAMDLAESLSPGGAEPLPPPAGLDMADVVRTGFERVRESSVVDHREGITTTVAVTRTVLDTPAPGVSLTTFALRVNGKPDASLTVRHRSGEPPESGEILSSGDMETQMLSGALPLFLDLPSGDALVVGWGSGISVATLSSASPRRIVAVELEREVVSAARVFRRFVPPDDAGIDLRFEDGRNLLLLDPARYSTIVSEPSNPWITGASSLFTEDFFRLVRRRLVPGGVFVQWLQAYEISPASVRSILAALTRVFPSVTVLRMVHSRGDLLLVCGERAHRWKKPDRLPPLLSRIAVATAEDVASRIVATPARARAFAGPAAPNRDDRPFVEFRAPLDLIRFRRWGSDAIVKALAGRAHAARPPPVQGLEPAALARSLLLAGRPEASLAILGRGPTAEAARRMIRAKGRGLDEEVAWSDLGRRLAAARAAPEVAVLQEAVADAYLALGYPEIAAARYLAAGASGDP